MTLKTAITQPRVLIVDDDIDTLVQLRRPLELANFSVEFIQDGSEAIKHILYTITDILLLDLDLPTLDGWNLLRMMSLYQRTTFTRTIVISEQFTELDRIAAFELGVDDYIRKPFNIREVILRSRAVYRRNNSVPNQSIRKNFFFNQLEVYLTERRVFCGREEVVLTKTEFDLLVCLVKSPNQIFSRYMLSEVVGLSMTSKRSARPARTVDSHISKLRSRLGKVGKQIKSVYGKGFVYVNN